MLLSVYLPFSDFRPLMVEGFSRLQRPAWPIPDPTVEHLRGLGSVRQRNKPGFEGWVGEDRLVVGASGFALALPYRDKDLGRIRLVRKACFFDGILNGRLELLFTFEAATVQRDRVAAAVRRILNVGVNVIQYSFKGTILGSPKAVACLWADATVAHGKDIGVEWIRAGRPVCIVESDSVIDGPSGSRTASSANSPNIDVTVLPTERHTELITIAPMGGEALQVLSRAESRLIRTYLFRLLQNTESLSLLLGLSLDAVDDDRIQIIFNEYTRQINRSRQRLEVYSLPELVKYCYAAFDRIYPGRAESRSGKKLSRRNRL